MKKTSCFNVILYGACAGIWGASAILGIVYHTYNDSIVLFVLHELCAVLWIVVFIVNLKRYIANSDKKKSD